MSAPPPGSITSRAPLFPVGIAATDLLFGRQFWAIRLGNIACMSVIVGLLCGWARTVGGRPAALIAGVLLLLVDTRTRLYSRAILTEASTAVIVAFMCCALWRYSRRGELRWLISAAVLLGLEVLSRSMLILWLPVILLLLILPRSCVPVSHRMSRRIRDSLLFVAIVVAVQIPWGIRNCLLLRAFMPLGTMGSSQLPAGFSDRAWEFSGVWKPLTADRVPGLLAREQVSTAEWERASAQQGQAVARKWITANPGKSLALFPLKVWQEVRPHSIREGLLLGLALLGAVWLRGSVVGRWSLGICLACLFSIGCTWSVEGRFLVPWLFPFHVLATAGAWGLASRVMGTRFTLPD